MLEINNSVVLALLILLVVSMLPKGGGLFGCGCRNNGSSLYSDHRYGIGSSARRRFKGVRRLQGGRRLRRSGSVSSNTLKSRSFRRSNASGTLDLAAVDLRTGRSKSKGSQSSDSVDLREEAMSAGTDVGISAINSSDSTASIPNTPSIPGDPQLDSLKRAEQMEKMQMMMMGAQSFAMAGGRIPMELNRGNEMVVSAAHNKEMNDLQHAQMYIQSAQRMADQKRNMMGNLIPGLYQSNASPGVIQNIQNMTLV